MAHKKLLTEAEIRRFMKLATIGGVGDTKIQEMGYGIHDMAGARDEEDEELEMDAEMGEMPVEEPLDDTEMDLEGPPGDEEDAGGMETPEREELLAQVVDAVAQVLGVEADVEGVEGEEGDLGEPDEMEMDVEMGAEEGGEELPAELAPEEEPEEMMESDEDELEEEMDEDAIVNEVAKRVAARLVKENRREKMADQLVERIFARLTNK